MAEYDLGTASGKIVVDSDTKGLDDAQSKMRETEGSVESLATTLSGSLATAGTALSAALTAPIVAIGGAALGAALEVDRAFDTIKIGTGAVGDDLASLEGSFANVARRVPVDMGQVSGSITALNTLTGASGDSLDDMAASVLEASRMLGEDGVSNSEAFGKAVRQWQIDAEDAPGAMDALFTATQDYGVSLSGLMGQLTNFGPILQNAGYTMEESAAFFGQLEAGGVNVSRVMPALNQAFRNWADEGKNSREEFEKVVDQIKNTEDAQEALALASDVFGAQGAQRLTTAIRNGSLELEDMTAALGETEGAIHETAAATDSFPQMWQKVKNEATLALAPLGERFMPMIQDALEKVIPLVQQFADWFGSLSDTQVAVLIGFGAALASIGPLLLAASAAIKAYQTAVTVWQAVVKIATGVQKAFNLVMRANPIGLIITAIGLLVAAFIYLWNNVEGFRNFFIGVWEAIKTAANAVVSWFTDTVVPWFQGVWDSISAGLSAVGEFFSTIWNAIYTTVSTWITSIDEFITTVWNGIVEFFTTVLTAIWTAIEWYFTMIVTIITTIVTAIWTTIQTIWNAILTVIQTVMDAISAVISTVWNAIQTAVTTVVNAIQSVISSIFNAILSFITRVVNGWRNIIQNGWNAIRTAVSTVVNAIQSIISSVFNAISSTVSSIVSNIRSAITNAFNAARDGVRNAINSLKTSVTNGINSAYDTVVGIKDRILGFFSGAGRWLLDAGRNVIQGFIDGITGGFRRVRDKLSELTSFLPDWKGPAEKDKKLLTPSGEMILEGLVAGFDNRTDDVRRSLQGLTSMIPNELQTSIDASVTGNAATDAVARMGDTYSFGDILLSASDLEGLRTFEDFVSMMRRQARQRTGVR